MWLQEEKSADLLCSNNLSIWHWIQDNFLIDGDEIWSDADAVLQQDNENSMDWIIE